MPCPPPPHGRQVVHLPDVRLRPRAERLDRAHHPLDLHARIRRPPSALQLVHPGARHLAVAPVRVRTAEPDLHDDVETQTAETRAGGRRHGLGRPAYADDLRPAPQGIHAGFGTRLRRNGGRRQTRQRNRPRQDGVLRARGSQQGGRAPHGRPEPRQGDRDELPRREGGILRVRQQPRRSIGRYAAGALLARTLHRARRFHGESAQEILPPATGRRSAAALRLPHQVRGGGQGCRRKRRRAALHLRPAVGRRLVERRPPREGRHPLGIGPPRFRSRNPPVQPALHEGESRRLRGGTDVGGQPQSRIDDRHERLARTVAGGRRTGPHLPVRARRLLLPRHRHHARASRLPTAR